MGTKSDFIPNNQPKGKPPSQSAWNFSIGKLIFAILIWMLIVSSAALTAWNLAMMVNNHW
jgi:hypothetical protein